MKNVVIFFLCFVLAAFMPRQSSFYLLDEYGTKITSSSSHQAGISRRGGTVATIKVITSGAWTVRHNVLPPANWLTLSKTSGQGNGEFIVNVTENLFSGRMAKVTVSSGGATIKFKVTQNGTGAISAKISPENVGGWRTVGLSYWSKGGFGSKMVWN